MVDVEINDENEAPLISIRVLKLIKDAQQKHGLRYGNYQRYADYCGRRMRRLRKALGYTHKSGPKRSSKFVYKAIGVEDVVDARFIELLIYNVEKCWARGMEYKIGSENEVHTRQKFHARTRLLKALKCARILVDIANESSRVDSLTKSQTKSYATYIAGFHTLAKNNWAGDNASQLVDEIMQLELSDGRSAETDSAPPISKAAEQRAAETKEKKERKSAASAPPQPERVLPRPDYFDLALKYIMIPDEVIQLGS